MLKKTNRLSRKEFETHFKTGKRFTTPHLQLIHSPAPTFSAVVVVGKKVAKKAVIRNKIRRQVYGVVYRTYATKQQNGVFIVITKPSVNSLSRRALLTEMHQLLGLVK